MKFMQNNPRRGFSTKNSFGILAEDEGDDDEEFQQISEVSATPTKTFANVFREKWSRFRQRDNTDDVWIQAVDDQESSETTNMIQYCNWRTSRNL